ncbi:inositol-pentakisphosphate 2-kinase [Mucor mucedo]|uniref:inositol-pentakisphosphate 2-kinase n=1 Tax=Mucor mucedo TaxID=29922 RepID=UPI0022201838|nr:inositol-pentakisphosphate 2-kinase [Mucor mucedo]KAI7892797.1 inositol-pentakisphosphate 2-kinase [Mucor mucedo]
MNFSLCESDADHWIYAGEGNLNLVVRYTGDNQIYKGKVLRVIKNSKNKQGPIQDTIVFKKQFSERVIQPLLGKEYVVQMSPVETSSGFLKRLAKHVEPFRPAFRTDRQIVTDSPISFLLNDLTQVWPNSPTLTYELKPKWGFKPDSSFISRNDIKKSSCRFCMHSYLREIPANDFCPLDLYSADRSRIQKAVRVLFTEKSLSKTLSVSVDGEKLSLGSVDRQNLLGFTNNDTDLMQEILTNVILKDPILQIIKQLQTHLDELDVEGIYSLCHQNKDLLRLVTDDICIWKDVVDLHQKRRQDNPGFFMDGVCNTEEQKQRVYEYILSMTFKDCSIMINVTPSQATDISDKTIRLANGLSFRYDVKVIDTDLKSIEKIPYWFELDQSIVKHATETNFEKKCH